MVEKEDCVSRTKRLGEKHAQICCAAADDMGMGRMLLIISLCMRFNVRVTELSGEIMQSGPMTREVLLRQ